MEPVAVQPQPELSSPQLPWPDTAWASPQAVVLLEGFLANSTNRKPWGSCDGSAASSRIAESQSGNGNLSFGPFVSCTKQASTLLVSPWQVNCSLNPSPCCAKVTGPIQAQPFEWVADPIQASFASVLQHLQGGLAQAGTDQGMGKTLTSWLMHTLVNTNMCRMGCGINANGGGDMQGLT